MAMLCTHKYAQKNFDTRAHNCLNLPPTNFMICYTTKTNSVTSSVTRISVNYVNLLMLPYIPKKPDINKIPSSFRFID